VHGVFGLADLPEIRGPLGDPVPSGVEGRSRPVLAGDKVRYVGEPIAVVVADDPARAVDAADSVEIDYSPLEGVGDVDAATRPGASCWRRVRGQGPGVPRGDPRGGTRPPSAPASPLGGHAYRGYASHRAIPRRCS